MTGIRTLKFVSASFEKRNPKGSFVVGTFKKVVRNVQILSAVLKKNILTPLFKNQPSLVGKEAGGRGWGVVVDFKKMELPSADLSSIVYLKLLGSTSVACV